MSRGRSGGPASKSRSAMADVASLAGVSLGTVSNVLNHPERVAPATREKVDRAIEMLRYKPHGPARSLAVGSMPALGLVVSDLRNSLFVDIGRGVERAAAEHGVFVLIANSDGALERERQYLDMYATSRVLGSLVTLNEDQHYHELISESQDDGAPLILLNYAPQYPTHCSVHINNRLGGRIAAEHLLGIGRRRIAFVGGPTQLQPVAERRTGFLETLAAQGISLVADERPAEINRSDGWAVGHRLLPLIERGEIDGIFAVSDLLAAGVVQAIGAGSTVRVPDDVAIVGYDDNQESWDSPMPLTTIRQPGEAMGYEGARLIFDELRSPDHTHRALDLSPELVVRRSTVSGAP